MDFALSPRAEELCKRLEAFMDECVYPNEAVYHRQIVESGDPHVHAPVLDELKVEARERGLWNLFLPHASSRWCWCPWTRRGSPTSATCRCSATRTTRATASCCSRTSGCRPITCWARRAAASPWLRPGSAPAGSTTACGPSALPSGPS